MKQNFLRKGRLIVLGLAALLLLVGGGWWLLGSQRRAAEAPPSSPVLVFLLSPSSGDEVEAGDFVSVTLQAAAPETIVSAELFVDGQSLGEVKDTPESAFWSWRAWPVGIHTLSARATAADGQVGQSQTVIVNVLVGDGMVQVPAAEEQTLEQVGADFGVPPDQMAGANPHIDPSAPLKEGQPVQVPAGGEAPQPSGEEGNGSGGEIPLTITWELKLTKPADKSYCYLSNSDGVWDKIPKPPFDFFQRADNLYTQIFDAIPAQETDIQAECWGWLGGALQFLGQGATRFDPRQMPVELVVNGPGFQLTGMPQFKPLKDTGGGDMIIPPPFALREPLNKDECHRNHGLGALFYCGFLDAPVKEYYVLVWEWAPPACWPGTCITKIDGYRLYEIDSVTKTEKLLKEFNDQGSKAAAVPLPWGAKCYGVRAFVNDPAVEDSAMATYCPGQPPTPQEITLTPTNWLTTAILWRLKSRAGCHPGVLSDLADANQPGEVVIADKIHDGDDCYWHESSAAAVKFELSSLPSNWVIQKAVLTHSEVYYDYFRSGEATNEMAKPSCVGDIGEANEDWTSEADPYLWSSNYFIPLTSGSDVTAAIKDWIKHPEENRGFILLPAPPLGSYYTVDGVGDLRCVLVADVQLDLYYFAP